MQKVTDIVFGDPVTPVATATTGNLENKLITIGRNDDNVTPNDALKDTDERMKVQWRQNGRPQRQVRRRVVGNDSLIAVHLDEKADSDNHPDEKLSQ